MSTGTQTSSSPAALHKPVFYGWIIVLTTFLVMPIVFGIRLSFSVFFTALVEEYGWSRGGTSLIFTVSMLTFALTSTLIGVAIDRHGTRVGFSLGALIMAAGLVLSSLSTQLWHLVVAWGVITGLGFTALGQGQMAALLARWFRRRRGIAVGITFAGVGLGTAVLIPLLEFVISAAGWRAAYLVLAALSLLIIPLSVLLLVDGPEQRGLYPDGDRAATPPGVGTPRDSDWTLGSAARTASFWLMFVAGLGTMGPLRMLTVHQVSIMVDAGFSRMQAAQIVGISGLAIVGAYIGFGWLSDKAGRPTAFAIGSVFLLVCIALLGGLRAGTPLLVLYIYAVLIGLGEGARSAVYLAMASDLFPGRSVGAISGTMAAAMSLGAAFFPWLAGHTFDTMAGGYIPAFWAGAVVLVVTTGALWLATRLRPVGQSEPSAAS